ncbi:unnamed protein product [Enterobius vermicularis]|uniref:Protein YIPF3 n=1 Tax=Enterobius vermicularis TaxID=51028 RepID=A0A0N4UYN3_ENTVE|nr:unnamed protein product [Enterobius vermicularis]
MSSATTRQRPSSFESQDKDTASTTNVNYMDFQGRLPQMVWEAGSKQVQDTFISYGRLDLFRPYFNVLPKQVRSRLIQSFIPRKPSKISVATDLYGPLMIILTLVALLLFSMKSSGYVVQDGTLMGTALVTCFGAWFLISLLISTMTYILSTDVTSLYIFTTFGYSLFGHCIVIFLTTVFHPLHSHLFFYLLVFIFCFPSAARVSLFLCSKTRDNSHKIALAATVFVLHIGYICYLHFGFHTVLEGDHFFLFFLDVILNDFRV